MSEHAPESERLSLRQAADLFDPPKSVKAVQQLVARGALRVERAHGDQKAGRARRVWTTGAWLEEYAQRSGQRLRVVTPQPEADRLPDVSYRASAARIMNELNDENLRLKVRVAELEEELARAHTALESSPEARKAWRLAETLSRTR